MPRSARQTISGTNLDNLSKRELVQLFTQVQADITALRASVVGITTKLDNDAGVTDTNYTALWTPTIGTTA